VSSGIGTGAAASVPRRFFAALWAGWKKIAAKIAAVQTFILLLVIFIFVLGPIAMFMRLLRQDPMRLSRRAGTFWVFRASPQERLEDCARQF
jgi:Saxitoxin biosynthesis operon protein SxtJ